MGMEVELVVSEMSYGIHKVSARIYRGEEEVGYCEDVVSSRWGIMRFAANLVNEILRLKGRKKFVEFNEYSMTVEYGDKEIYVGNVGKYVSLESMFSVTCSIHSLVSYILKEVDKIDRGGDMWFGIKFTV